MEKWKWLTEVKWLQSLWNTQARSHNRCKITQPESYTGLLWVHYSDKEGAWIKMSHGQGLISMKKTKISELRFNAITENKCTGPRKTVAWLRTTLSRNPSGALIPVRPTAEPPHPLHPMSSLLAMLNQEPGAPGMAATAHKAQPHFMII